MPEARTTRLEAVNTILSAVGEAPLASLTDESGVESIMADQILSEIDREVQALGWHWNRRETTLSRDASNQIPVPDNVCRIDGDMGTSLSIRDGALYDLAESKSTFDDDMKLEITEYLSWENLPDAARVFITAAAARRYADRTVTDQGLSRMLREDEGRQWGNLRRHEILVSNARVYGPTMSRYVDRGGPSQWVY